MIFRLRAALLVVVCWCTPLPAQSIDSASPHAEFGRGFRPLVAALHVHSTYSNGRHNISALAGFASERKIDVLGISDSFLTRARYGVGPLKRLVSKSAHRPGVIDAGLENYLRDAGEAQRATPDVVVLPGVEVTPSYYWRGSYSTELQLFDFDRHLLVYGLRDPVVLKNLPVIENETLSNTPIRWAMALPPLSVLLAGLLLIAFPIRRTAKLRNFTVKVRKRFPRTGAVLLIAGAVWCYDAYPFGRLSDPYSGGHDPPAYQRLIDYVRTHGGYSIWSYPEAEYADVVHSGARMISRGHPEDLWLTKDYGGFEGLYGVRPTVTKPGSIWDRVLLDYTAGRRRTWPAAVTGLDFHDFGSNPWFELDRGQTILWAKAKDAASAEDALKTGRFYAVFQEYSDRKVLLRDYAIRHNNEIAIAGETSVGSDAELSATLTWDRGVGNETVPPFQVLVIRDGELIDKVEGPLPIKIARRDTLAKGMHYYRIMAGDGAVELLSNPIFVEAR